MTERSDTPDESSGPELDPRPTGFIAGSLHDLSALVSTTAAFLRAGLLPALAAMAVLWAIAALLVALAIFVGACFSPWVVVVPALTIAGPLAVFGRLAFGERLTVSRAISVALRSVTNLLVNTFALVLVAIGPLVFAALIAFALNPYLLFVVVPLLLRWAEWAVRYLLADAVVNVGVNGHVDRYHSISIIDAHVAPHHALFLTVELLPLAILAAASPTPFAQEIVGQAFGTQGQATFLACVGVAAFAVSVILGSALAAAAVAVTGLPAHARVLSTEPSIVLDRRYPTPPSRVAF